MVAAYLGGERLNLGSNGGDQARLAAVENAQPCLVLIAVSHGGRMLVARDMGMGARLRHGSNGGIVVNGMTARARMGQWLQNEGAEREQQERRR